jgi:hypothetical protein
MKEILLLLVSILLFGCSLDEKDCDDELKKLELLRQQGWVNCNGGAACIQKIESDYEKKKSEVLRKCN